MRSHFDTCGAPICAQGDIWYPDEDICVSKPRNKVQKNQHKIQALYLRGLVSAEYYFSTAQLGRIQSVRSGIKGKDPSVRVSPSPRGGK